MRILKRLVKAVLRRLVIRPAKRLLQPFSGRIRDFFIGDHAEALQSALEQQQALVEQTEQLILTTLRTVRTLADAAEANRQGTGERQRQAA